MSAIQRIIEKLQVSLKQQKNSLLKLNEIFLTYSNNNNKKSEVQWEEFCSILNKSGISPSPQDIRLIFIELDPLKKNKINFNQFISLLRGNNHASNKKFLLIKIFNLLDREKKGYVNISDLSYYFTPLNHPDVKNNRILVNNYLQFFFNSIQYYAENGALTLNQFTEYFLNATAFEDDIKFQELMSAIWNFNLNDTSLPSPPPNYNDQSLRDFSSSINLTPSNNVTTYINELKRQLRQFNIRDYIKIQRNFQHFDIANTGTINLVEFKKSLKDCNLILNDLEISQLFSHLDNDRKGVINYNDLLILLRNPLSNNRKQLINAAFEKIHKRGDNFVDAEDVVSGFNANRHPDVLSGRRSSDEILREFLDTFDVGRIREGMVSRKEFEDYYVNLSSIIDDDKYFELILRGTWGLGDNPYISSEEINRITQQNYNIQSEKASNLLSQANINKPHSKSLSSTAVISKLGADMNSIKISELGPNSNLNPNAIINSTVTKTLPNANAGLVYIIEKFKQEMKKRGSHGFIGLQRKFRIIDDDNDKVLSLGEFKKAFKEMKIDLSDSELRMLYSHFDVDNSGGVSFDEFIQGVREPLNDRRKNLVHQAFSKLDIDGNGIIDASEVASKYDASRHPEVLAGRLTANEVYTQFLDTFDVGGVKDGMVTREEFVNYYTNLGANIDNDDYFELMIRNSWHISGGEGAAANSANKRVLVTHADGRETVEEVVDNGSILGSYNKLSTKHYSTLPPQPPLTEEKAIALSGPVLNKNQSIKLQDPYSVKQQTAIEKTLTPALKYLLNKVKSEMKARGSHGFISLQRKFKVMDDNSDGGINLAEFKKGIKELGIPLSDSEMRTLFEYFDADGSGKICFDEFIYGFREPLNDRRLKLTIQAFNRLDRDGNGIIDASEVASKYDSSKHPDVLSGKKSSDEIYHEFLDTFDVGGVKDGMVTRDEFINYYTNLGANIDNDDYFELMICNSWNITPTGYTAPSEKSKPQTNKNSSSYTESPSNIFPLAKKRFNMNTFRGNLEPGLLPGTGTVPPPSNLTTGNKLKPRPLVNVSTAPVGIRVIIEKFKEEMKLRGAHGFIGLQRKFRIMDDDNNHLLDLNEFKKGMRETKVSLTDSELRMIFDYFDADSSGHIDFEEFIQGVRDPLNDRRLDLVNRAFSKLDIDGNNIIDASEVASKYDASRHPEVLAGRLTANEVFSQFLDTFDVGGVKDGMVTRDEFINYYTNLGANIDNDDYFELMIRNSWHISGGEGAAANSANKRVLVTHVDGRETVEEIKDDLGVKSDQYNSRLQSQGVYAQNVSSSGYIENLNKPKSSAPVNLSEIKKESIASKYKLHPAHVRNFNSSFLYHNSKPTTAEVKHHKPLPEPSYGVLMIIEKLKQEMKKRGSHGFIGLQRKFRIIDDDNDKVLSLGEFKKAFKEMKIDLSDSELRMLYSHFDVDNSGGVSFDEFIQGVRESLNDRRKNLVHQAFSKLDIDGNGIIDASEVASKYDASRHPDVLSGAKTPDQIYSEFLDTFDVGGVKDGMVTREEFVNYYTNLGANIDNDDYFELMIRNSWHISGGEGAAANSANKRVLVTHADGRETVEEIKDDLGVKSENIPGLIAKQRARLINASNISFSSNIDTTSPPSRPQTAPNIARQRYSEPTFNPFASQIDLKIDANVNSPKPINTSAKKITSLSNSLYPQSKPVSQVDSSNVEKTDKLMNIVRNELVRRGARGIIGIQRKFRIADDNGDSLLSIGEFIKVMKETNLPISVDDIYLLFKRFDKNGDENIDYDEFLYALRGPISQRRLDLINLAFSRLDKTGDGMIGPEDLISSYDTSRHPDVLSGTRNADDILREFLDTFDVGGVKDGMVTREEFVNYYTNISCLIDDDDYFELMIRNSWHISGGVGAAANSANKRVLVTHADGRETVEEIKDDLGVKSDQYNSRLQSQGVYAQNVSSSGYYESMNSSVNRARGFGQRPSTSGSYTSPVNNRNPVLGDGYEEKTKGRKFFHQTSSFSLA